MPSRTAWLCALLALPLLAAGAAADDPGGADIPVAADVPTLHGQLRLSLADAIEMALENNLQVEVQRHEPLIREADSRAAWGSFDPEFFSEFGYSDIETPNANVLFGTDVNEDKLLGGSGGFRGLIPWLSTEYELRLDGSEGKTNSAVEALSPEYRSGFSFELQQPLLRDLIWNEPWTRVKTTYAEQRGALEQFRTDVMDIVKDVEDAYWVLIRADEDVRVARKSLETASALLGQVETQHEVGVVSKVEVVEAEAGVAERDVNLITAENAYENQQDVLIDLVLGPGLRPESSMEIEPTDRPDEIISYEIDVPQAVAMAFEHRPELQIASYAIERNEYQLKFAKNQRLPALDAVLSWGQEGLSGEQSSRFDPCRFAADPVTCAANPPTIPSRNFGKSFDDYFTNDAANEFSARALFSIPIPNRRARGEVSKATVELRRSTVQKRRVEQAIILQVRKAVRDLESAREGIEAAERRRLAAAEQLRAEQVRLEYGESTPFDVLDRERDLVDAESQKIRAYQVYRTSATDLDRAQGTILRNRNIAIDRVRPLR